MYFLLNIWFLIIFVLHMADHYTICVKYLAFDNVLFYILLTTTDQTEKTKSSVRNPTGCRSPMNLYWWKMQGLRQPVVSTIFSESK